MFSEGSKISEGASSSDDAMGVGARFPRTKNSSTHRSESGFKARHKSQALARANCSHAFMTSIGSKLAGFPLLGASVAPRVGYLICL